MTKRNLHDAEEIARVLRACADLMVLLSVTPSLDFEVKRRALRATLEVLHEIQNDVVAMLAPTNGTIVNLSEFPEDLETHADPHGSKPS